MQWFERTVILPAWKKCESGWPNLEVYTTLGCKDIGIRILKIV